MILCGIPYVEIKIEDMMSPCSDRFHRGLELSSAAIVCQEVCFEKHFSSILVSPSVQCL
jgi:hypothetical protein